LKPAWEWFNNVGEKIWSILKSAFETAKNYITNAINSILSRIPFIGSGRSKHQFGGYIASEGLYYLHAGETVTPSVENNNQDINITINVSGKVDKDIIDEIVRRLHNELSIYRRW